MKRAAIYLRVSTEEQSRDNQREDIERVVQTRGYKLVDTYEETESAARTRAEFSRMMREAHEGRFDVLIVWAIDRFGRSMAGNMDAILALDRSGVEVVSVREPWLDTGGAVRPLLIAIFSWIAEQERHQLIARTNAGIARARKKGIRLGRPQATVDLRAALRLRAQGLSFGKIAQTLRIPKTTLLDALRRSEKGVICPAILRGFAPLFCAFDLTSCRTRSECVTCR